MPVVWWLVHAGSVWLNAAFDEDEGVVLWGGAQDVPAATRTVSLSALALAVGLAACMGSTLCLLTSLAAGLAVLYSHPRCAWKAKPIAGPFVNAVGYGLLSPAAGWVIADVPATPRTLSVAALLVATALSVYFFAQVFQEEEDRVRNYRTLVATHGPAMVVLATRGALGFAFGGLVLLSAVGWFPRVCMLVLPGWIGLDRWLRRQGERAQEPEVRSFVLQVSMLGITLVALAFLDFTIASFEYGVAGLGTQFRW